MLTYLFQQYARVDQDRGLKRYGECGYRHWWLSWPDARSWGVTIEQYVDDTKRILDAGLSPATSCGRKTSTATTRTSPRSITLVDALLDDQRHSLGGARVGSELVLQPDHYRAMIDHDATRAPSVRWCMHLQEQYADFGPNGEGHGPAFWNANLAVGVKTLLYQYRTNWSAGMMQARGNDVSVRLIQGGLWGLPADGRLGRVRSHRGSPVQQPAAR
jgi:hypothetical protein